MDQSSMMSGYGAGNLCSGTGVGWGADWGRGKAQRGKVSILLYKFCIYEPYLSEGIVFSFFIDRMASMSEDVWRR